MYKNIKTTLNYFALAIMTKNYIAAIMIADLIYEGTYHMNSLMYKSKQNDKLYQKTINPDLKINKE